MRSELGWRDEVVMADQPTDVQILTYPKDWLVPGWRHRFIEAATSLATTRKARVFLVEDPMGHNHAPSGMPILLGAIGADGVVIHPMWGV